MGLYNWNFQFRLHKFWAKIFGVTMARRIFFQWILKHRRRASACLFAKYAVYVCVCLHSCCFSNATKVYIQLHFTIKNDNFCIRKSLQFDIAFTVHVGLYAPSYSMRPYDSKTSIWWAYTNRHNYYICAVPLHNV